MENKQTQKGIFLNFEADNWFKRNFKDNKLKEDDLIITYLDYDQINSRSRILEIGCSNGWRLNLINKKFKASCFGIDPSSEAILEGMKANLPNFHLEVGTADKLPFENCFFDVVILGFFLYLVDREDLFKIAYEVDRVLKYSGSLIVYDFDPGFPKMNPYHHKEGIFSYKQDYGKMFLWNPDYFLKKKDLVPIDKVIGVKNPDNRYSVQLLKKEKFFN